MDRISYSAYSGGFVGYSYKAITNCYSIGKVSGTSTVNSYNYLGGFCGYRSSNAITNCVYDSATSGMNDNANKGVPKSTLSLGLQITYTSWDFANVWRLNSGMNDGYPYLAWEIPPTPVESITLSQSTALLQPGESVTLIANVAPDDAANKSVTWTSTNSTVATVSGGLVKASSTVTGTATATIIAKSVSNPEITASCTVTVSDNSVAVTGITLSRTTAVLKPGDTLQLTADVAPADASDKSISWSSSNNQVATISSGGLITAVGNGTAIITATPLLQQL